MAILIITYLVLLIGLQQMQTTHVIALDTQQLEFKRLSDEVVQECNFLEKRTNIVGHTKNLDKDYAAAMDIIHKSTVEIHAQLTQADNGNKAPSVYDVPRTYFSSLAGLPIINYILDTVGPPGTPNTIFSNVRKLKIDVSVLLARVMLGHKKESVTVTDLIVQLLYAADAIFYNAGKSSIEVQIAIKLGEMILDLLAKIDGDSIPVDVTDVAGVIMDLLRNAEKKTWPTQKLGIRVSRHLMRAIRNYVGKITDNAKIAEDLLECARDLLNIQGKLTIAHVSNVKTAADLNILAARFREISNAPWTITDIVADATATVITDILSTVNVAYSPLRRFKIRVSYQLVCNILLKRTGVAEMAKELLDVARDFLNFKVPIDIDQIRNAKAVTRSVDGIFDEIIAKSDIPAANWKGFHADLKTLGKDLDAGPKNRAFNRIVTNIKAINAKIAVTKFKIHTQTWLFDDNKIVKKNEQNNQNSSPELESH